MNNQLQIGEIIQGEFYKEEKTEVFYNLELIRKPVIRESSFKIDSPRVIAKKYNEYFKSLDREHFEVLHLDTKNKVIAKEIISIGSLNSTIVHPREVFKGAILNNSASILLMHNHPSGDTKPSNEDINITIKLIDSGDILGIKVLDHLIFGQDKYLSFKEEKYI